MVGPGKAAGIEASSPDRLTQSIEAYLTDHPAAAPGGSGFESSSS